MDTHDGLYVWLFTYRSSRYGPVNIAGPYLYEDRAEDEYRRLIQKGYDWIGYPERVEVDTKQGE